MRASAAVGRRRLAAAAAGLILVVVPMAAAREQVAGSSRSDAVAIASAINVTAQDLPGFTDDGAPPSRGPTRAERRAARCDGTLRFVRQRLAFVTSRGFRQDAADGSFHHVVSQVSVFPTARLAAANLAALGSKRVPKCNLPTIKAAFGRNADKVRARMHRIPSPVAGSIGWRITLLPGTGEPRREFTDIQTFARRRVVVALSTTSFPDVFPQQVEDNLTKLLAARAEKAR